MAKKFGKFLFGTALVGAAAAAAAYFYNQKKDEGETIPLDEEDEDEAKSSDRSYTSLNHSDEADGDLEDEDEDLFTPLSETAKEVAQAAKDQVEKVEEFFDENDPTDETSAKES